MALLHTAGRTAASAARQSFFDRPRASLTALGWLMTYHLVSRKAQTSSARPILQFCLYLSFTRGELRLMTIVPRCVVDAGSGYGARSVTSL